ncbi:MAG: DUF2179 domain-containing protein [Ruminococcaceae bacterium]|nr:DUF2179 domain-containing protein [Oscillospiraceae bacterium]
MNKYQHSATIIETQGMYTDENYYMVVTILHNKSITKFMNTMKQYPETFIYFSDGVKVQSDFHFRKSISSQIAL